MAEKNRRASPAAAPDRSIACSPLGARGLDASEPPGAADTRRTRTTTMSFTFRTPAILRELELELAPDHQAELLAAAAAGVWLLIETFLLLKRNGEVARVAAEAWGYGVLSVMRVNIRAWVVEAACIAKLVAAKSCQNVA
ncbi:hypothetical protein GUJ93_ZPchr0003g17018 [Zizania palustris]|uniref:Uncharacterized protein n=1 Tax=Zizania palustris TaxID=103762 RepID=A0A8J5VXI1_ZIZPA|nr:hypothetical protein GUJ93_ZPchr0003g17018 [Zizania palustris]